MVNTCGFHPWGPFSRVLVAPPASCGVVPPDPCELGSSPLL